MYDQGLSVLEQYGLEAGTTRRGRGALIVETQQGMKIIKEFHGSEKKLRLQRQLQRHIMEHSNLKVDCVLETQEGEVAAKDQDGVAYTVRDWYPGRECDAKMESDVLECVRTLARLHNVMQLDLEVKYQKESLVEECKRHNREIRKVKNVIQKKHSGNEFEYCLLRCADRFLARGEAVVKELEKKGYDRLRERSDFQNCICHGDCSHHHFLFSQGAPMLINYDHWNMDCQEADLALFMRKVLEKNNWNIKMGQRMIKTYQEERPISPADVWYLKMRLSYPWKFWKLVNRYVSNAKPWLFERNAEKLQGLLKREESWCEFLVHCFEEP